MFAMTFVIKSSQIPTRQSDFICPDEARRTKTGFLVLFGLRVTHNILPLGVPGDLCGLKKESQSKILRMSIIHVIRS
jgi:hypothetical protein